MSEKRFNERLSTATLEQRINAEDTVLRSLDYEGNEAIKGKFIAGDDIVATDAQGNEISMRQLAAGGGGGTPQFILMKTKAKTAFDGYAINIPSDRVSGMLRVAITKDPSALVGYSLHSVTILDDIPEVEPGEEPIYPDIYAVITQICYDPYEEEVRAWIYKVGKTDWALQRQDVNVSILFVKDSE